LIITLKIEDKEHTGTISQLEDIINTRIKYFKQAINEMDYQRMEEYRNRLIVMNNKLQQVHDILYT
jgi:hypothetical protein